MAIRKGGTVPPFSIGAGLVSSIRCLDQWCVVSSASARLVCYVIRQDSPGQVLVLLPSFHAIAESVDA